MAKVNIIGSVEQDADLVSNADLSAFDDTGYSCIALYVRRDGKPVTMSVSKDQEHVTYRVMDRICDFYFNSRKEAEDFCDLRGYQIKKRK